jgi:predicted nucleic acid-binding protein
MPWLIDTDIFIEGERGHSAFIPWLQSADGIATADVVRGEFLIGAHAVAENALRQRGVEFYSNRIAALPSFSSEPADYAKAAMLAGEARRKGLGKPGLIDGLIAAIALRTGATVATQNTKDFTAMGCPCANPLLQSSGEK